MMMKKPLIGLTTYGRDEKNAFSLPAQYLESVRRAGAVPFLIAPDETELDEILPMLSGLILTGGGDMNPESYHGDSHETIYMIDVAMGEEIPRKGGPGITKSDILIINKIDLAEYVDVSIEKMRIELLNLLSPFFKKFPNDITEENIQSRFRGLILMALSNKTNSLLIATGNKSEYSVGYSTLYGDMCGGFALLKDLYKTKVYDLCNWINNKQSCFDKKIQQIPVNIINKEPTAELKFEQKDSDSLPPYEVLDKILELLIDKNEDLKSIIDLGYKKNQVKMIWNLIKKSEFKRYQSALGPKLTKMSLANDRRFPVTNKFEL